MHTCCDAHNADEAIGLLASADADSQRKEQSRKHVIYAPVTKERLRHTLIQQTYAKLCVLNFFFNSIHRLMHTGGKNIQSFIKCATDVRGISWTRVSVLVLVCTFGGLAVLHFHGRILEFIVKQKRW